MRTLWTTCTAVRPVAVLADDVPATRYVITDAKLSTSEARYASADQPDDQYKEKRCQNRPRSTHPAKFNCFRLIRLILPPVSFEPITLGTSPVRGSTRIRLPKKSGRVDSFSSKFLTSSHSVRRHSTRVHCTHPNGKPIAAVSASSAPQTSWGLVSAAGTSSSTYTAQQQIRNAKYGVTSLSNTLRMVTSL